MVESKVAEDAPVVFEQPSHNPLLDQLDSVLDDKDTFVIKLPHKFKEFLSTPQIYTLGQETEEIGSVELLRAQRGVLVPSKGDDDSRIELMMPLNLPARTNRQTSERVLFELGLPSLSEISKMKRRKLNFEGGLREMSFVCQLEDKAQQLNDSDGYPKRRRHRWQGDLVNAVIGEATMRPSSVADMDHKHMKVLSEEQIWQLATSADDKRASVALEVIEESIPAPSMVWLEEPKEEPTQKRVSLSTDRLRELILRCFDEKPHWRVEEIADKLNHPKEPINRLMRSIGDLDPIRKYYSIKNMF